MRYRLALASGVAFLVACAHAPETGSPLFDGHERTYLTLSLAENTTQLVVLKDLHSGNQVDAVEALQFELDARVLFLAEILQTQAENPAVAEKRESILCHLDAIRRYREEHGTQTKYPDIAAMADEALRSVPGCPKCPESPTPGAQAHDRSG